MLPPILFSNIEFVPMLVSEKSVPISLFVFGLAKNYNIPIAVVLAGGYAYKYEDTVEIHYNTIMAALNI